MNRKMLNCFAKPYPFSFYLPNRNQSLVLERKSPIAPVVGRGDES